MYGDAMTNTVAGMNNRSGGITAPLPDGMEGRETMSVKSWKYVFDELDKCTRLMSVQVIMKDGKMCGRVVSRYSKSGGTTFVTFQIFGGVAINGNGTGIMDTKAMSGWGYDRTSLGIGEILKENREELMDDYGIKLNGQDWEIQNRWQKDFENAGYDVISAI